MEYIGGYVSWAISLFIMVILIISGATLDYSLIWIEFGLYTVLELASFMLTIRETTVAFENYYLTGGISERYEEELSLIREEERAAFEEEKRK